MDIKVFFLYMEGHNHYIHEYSDKGLACKNIKCCGLFTYKKYHAFDIRKIVTNSMTPHTLKSVY